MKETSNTPNKPRKILIIKHHLQKWMSLIASLIIMSLAGTPYIFATYAPYIKDKFKYTQSAINLIGSMSSAGFACVVIPGYITDRFNGRITSIYAAVLMGGGFLCTWLAIHRKISAALFYMSIYHFMIGHGTIAAYTAVLKTNVKNFSAQHRGKVVGVSIAMYGLSSAWIAQVYQYVFNPDIPLFILALAASSIIILIMGTAFLGETKYPTTEEPTNQNEKTKLLKPNEMKSIDKESIDVTGFDMLKYPEFWMLFFIFVVANGSIRTVSFNLGSHVLSLGGKPGDQDILVTILAIANCFGRIGFGFFVDFISKYVSLTFPLAITCLLMVLSHGYLIFVKSPNYLFPGVILCGISYGGVVTVLPTMVSKLWGTKYFGTNWGMFFIGSIIGAFLLGSLLPGALYDLMTEKGSKDCFGAKCFLFTFIISTAINVLSLFSSGVVWGLEKRKRWKKKQEKDLIIN